jgi:hypothetical protein
MPPYTFWSMFGCNDTGPKQSMIRPLSGHIWHVSLVLAMGNASS